MIKILLETDSKNSPIIIERCKDSPNTLTFSSMPEAETPFYFEVLIDDLLSAITFLQNNSQHKQG